MKRETSVEVNWQLENDVRVMEEYQKIVSDKDRLTKVLNAIEKKVDNLQERAAALEKTKNSFTTKKK